MKFIELTVGTIFAIEGSRSYPKLKLNQGYVDIRDEIYKDSLNFPDRDVEIITKEDLHNDFQTRFGMSRSETDQLLEKLSR